MTPEIKSDVVKVSPALARLLEHIGSLWNAFNIAFKRTFETTHQVDHVVFFYGRSSIEDFSQILLLCQHGYGSGANALLRGMYERAVTAKYLSQHPDEAADFLDFYWIAQRRLATQINETFGKGLLSEKALQNVETNYQRVKGKFAVTVCDKCKTSRTNHTWTKLDFVTMARQTGPLGQLIVPGYALPTQEAHATVRALLDRVTQDEDGVLMFDGDAKTDEVDRVLISAHNIVLAMLELQKEHFNLDILEEPLQQCLRDFKIIWKIENPGPTAT